MNIFVLDTNPVQAARWHCDAHIVKMTLETAQILSSVHHLAGGGSPYRPTHLRHPCVEWARTTCENYQWLTALGLELCVEYTNRYSREHASSDVICWASRNVPSSLPSRFLTPFVQVVPAEHRTADDAVTAYRAYYQTKRGGKLGTWKRNRPDWWQLTG